MAEVVTPLLDTISRYTGTAVTLFVSSVPTPGEKALYVKAIHSGTTKDMSETPGQIWSRYDPAGFKEAGRLFSKFITQTDSMCSLIYSLLLLTEHCIAISHESDEDGGDPPPPTDLDPSHGVRALSNIDEDERETSEESNRSDRSDSSDSSDDSDSNEPLANMSRRRTKKARTGRRSNTGTAQASRLDRESLEHDWAAMKISSALRDSMEELQGEERTRRMVDITQATEFDLAREEQIAANKATLLRILNREPIAEQPVRPIEPPALEDSDPPPPLEPTAPSPRYDELATWPVHTELVPLTSSPPVVPGTMHTQSAALTAVADGLFASSSASAKIHFFRTVNPDGWPDWLNSGYTHLSDAHLGAEYETALVTWTELERAYEWENVRSLMLFL